MIKKNLFLKLTSSNEGSTFQPSIEISSHIQLSFQCLYILLIVLIAQRQQLVTSYSWYYTAWATIYRDNFFRHSHWDAHHARAFWHERDRCARIVPPTVAKSREKHCREDARRFRIHVDRGVTRNYRPVHVSHPESCRLSRLEHFSLVSPPTPFFEFIGTKTDEWTLHYFVHDPAAPRILRNVIVNVHVYANEFFPPPFFFFFFFFFFTSIRDKLETLNRGVYFFFSLIF